MTWPGTPQGGRPPYTGLGVYPGGPPPRRPGRRNVVLITLLVLVIVAGGVTAAVLLLSPGARQATPGTTTQALPATTPNKPTTRPLPPARNTGWKVIANEDSGLVYEVPTSWTLGANTMSRPGGVLSLSGLAAARPFQCDGTELVRGEVGSGRLAQQADPATVAGAVAEGAAKGGYSSPAVRLAHPVPAKVDGLSGSTVVAEVSATAPNPCHASKVKITVLALSTPKGVAAVKVEVPEDGKDAEHSPSAEDVRKILDSVRTLN